MYKFIISLILWPGSLSCVCLVVPAPLMPSCNLLVCALLSPTLAPACNPGVLFRLPFPPALVAALCAH
jgi:hypothetical protein